MGDVSYGNVYAAAAHQQQILAGGGSSSNRKNPPAGRPPPVSRLQQMQAQLQHRLHQEKEQTLNRLGYSSSSSNSSAFGYGTEPDSGTHGRCNGNGPRDSGGAVRQYFAQRRAVIQQGGAFNVSPPSSGHHLVNGGYNTITLKHGSPVGWDKSHPLAPIERTSSGSSSGYESSNGLNASRNSRPTGTSRLSPTRKHTFTVSSNPNSVNSNTLRIAASRRAPSLDRRQNTTLAGGSGGYRPPPGYQGGMRRSSSQILTPATTKEQSPPREARTHAFLRKQPANMPRGAAAVAAARARQAATSQEDILDATNNNNNNDTGFRKHRPSLGSQSQPTSPPPRNPGYMEIPLDNLQPKRKPTPAVITDRNDNLISHKPNPQPKAAVRPSRNPPAPTKQPGGGRAATQTSSAHDPNLTECPICGRRFAKDRIDKHEEICSKSAKKKRKVFDPAKMRMKGTELEDFVRKSNKGGRRGRAAPEANLSQTVNNENKPEKKKPDWREKRANFIETIRQAKIAQKHVAAGGKLSDLPPPPPMDTSDYIQCPHCGRRFAEGAAERHIPKCKNIKSNKK